MTAPDEQQPELEHVIVGTDLATYNVYIQVHMLCLKKVTPIVDTVYITGKAGAEEK